MAHQSELLAYGFCRDIEEEIQQEIPAEISQIVLNFISKYRVPSFKGAHFKRKNYF